MTACTTCQTEFTKQRMGQKVCSPICAARLVRTQKAEQTARKKVERAMDKKRAAALETIPQLIKKAQHAFNAFIRERDKARTCICCQQPLGTGDVGGLYDCGHYRSTGSASHLRFDEDNAHAQRKYCNRHGAGRAVDYRIGLIARIGLERVEALECNNEVVRWDRDTLRQIAVIYRAKLRQLQKENA